MPPESPTGEAVLSYTYDDSNNRKTMTAADGATIGYYYDKNNRLVKETKSISGTDEITNYYYDNNGNQTFKYVETINPANSGYIQGISGSVVGKEASDLTTTLNGYNGLNQLTSTIVADKTISYTYNGDGLRSGKTVNGVVTTDVWDGDQIVLELNGGAFTAKYVRGANLIYAEDGAGANNTHSLRFMA